MSKGSLQFLCMTAGLLTLLGCQSAEIEDRDGSVLSTWRIQDDLGIAEPCQAPDAGQRAGAGEPVVLGTLPVYCDLVAVPVVVLRSSEAGGHPDPGQSVVMSREGRYYTSSAHGQQILEWSSEGEFIRAVGATGDGPGEFNSRGGIRLLIGPGDSIFVLDGAPRWSVFDADLNFQRSFSGQFNGREPAALHLVDGLGILSTTNVPAGSFDHAASFHWTSFEGVPGTSFGPQIEESSTAPQSRVRVSSKDLRGGIWVAPPNGAPGGMIFENWDWRGSRVSVLERKVPWHPEQGYSTSNSSREPSLPEYDYMYVDPQGLLWVTVIVRDARWRPLAEDEQRAMQHELYDARMEVLDPATGTVLVSLIHDGPNEVLPPFARFLGQRRSYRVVEDGQGLRSIEIYDIHLVSR